MVDPVSSLAAGSQAQAAERRKVHDAAAQFEALMIAQVLKSAHAGSEGWLGAGEDQASESMMGIAEEHLAQVLASQGGLGLANLVVRGLDRTDSATPQPAQGKAR